MIIKLQVRMNNKEDAGKGRMRQKTGLFELSYAGRAGVVLSGWRQQPINIV
jgi:hypothetical protein